MASDLEFYAVEREAVFTGGVNSGVDPDLVRQGQIAWSKNMTTRGGKLKTRPAYIERALLPNGRSQALKGISLNFGSLITSIGGFLYEVDLDSDYAMISLASPIVRNPMSEETFMEETSGSLVIQDGEATPLIFNGSSIRFASNEEVPKGKQMAYGNGRLWVARGGGRLEAGNIVDGAIPQSELEFTEDDYLLGGGSLNMPGDITGMKFIPSNDRSSGFGSLIVYGRSFTTAIRADIVSRSQWDTVENFLSVLFPEIGCSSQQSLASVNQDLFWRDGKSGLRSLKQSVADYESAGSSPLSNEVSRIVDNESDDMVDQSSSVYYNNRLIVTASPFFVYQGITAYKSQIALDFTQLANLSGKSPAVYDGEWTGFNATHSARVIHRGKERLFFISKDSEGFNRLWEQVDGGRDDISIDLNGDQQVSRIQQEVEFKRFFFGDPTLLKRLERVDLWLSDYDNLDITLYWRVDQSEQWNVWDTRNVCTDVLNEGATFKELRYGNVSKLTSFTLPDDQPITGTDFQIKVRFTGHVKLDRMMSYASRIEDPVYTAEEDLETACSENEVELRELFYEIPVFNVEAGSYVDEITDQYVDENGDSYTG